MFSFNSSFHYMVCTFCLLPQHGSCCKSFMAYEVFICWELRVSFPLQFGVLHIISDCWNKALGKPCTFGKRFSACDKLLCLSVNSFCFCSVSILPMKVDCLNFSLRELILRLFCVGIISTQQSEFVSSGNTDPVSLHVLTRL